MVTSDYRYTIVLFRQDHTLLGQTPLDVDWEPAAQWARFTGIRRGELSPGGAAMSTAVTPVWHETSGEPYVSTCRVTVTEPGGQVRCELPGSYFTPLARRASAGLVEQGKLRQGELFKYLVRAYPGEADPEPAPAGNFTVETLSPPLDLKDSRLADYSRRAGPFVQASPRDAPSGAGEEIDDVVPVFLPRRVLEEASALTRKAGALETGGVLIGHLHRDRSVPELFVEVTAQVPAKHVRSELTRLTFTPDTWAAARGAIRLRRKGEIMVGWWHSHSYLKETCKDCEKRKDGSCDVGALFLSADDCTFHQTCFPSPYSVALVVADSPCSGLTWALFGWQYGQIRPRGFHVLAETRTPTRDPRPAAVGEHRHAET